MTLIILGLALWTFLHFMPASKARLRSKLIKSMGPIGYTSLFAISIVGSIVLMAMGWRSADQWGVYTPPEWLLISGYSFAVVGVVLFGFGFDRNMKTNLKRFVRHLQLTGMLFWATGHLLLNGDNRSVLLFGGLGLWALVMMALVNRRDGDWIKPEKVAARQEFIPFVIACLFLVSFVFGHSWLSGISGISILPG